MTFVFFLHFYITTLLPNIYIEWMVSILLIRYHVPSRKESSARNGARRIVQSVTLNSYITIWCAFENIKWPFLPCLGEQWFCDLS